MLKNDAKIIIIILLMALITHSLAPEWCTWVSDSVVGSGLLWAYGFLSTYCIISSVLALLLLIFGLIWSWRIFIDEDFRWYRPALLLWGYIVMFDQNTLRVVQIWDGFDFRDLSLLIAGFVILTMLGKSLNRFWPYQDSVYKWWNDKRKTKSVKNKTDKATGFPNDDIKPQNTPKALQQYAEVISDQLLGTKLDEHSFAMGITGEWGSGKTTFLDLLESKLEGKAEIVTFNPWMCRTPEQVTDDFFATLQHQLSRRHSSLSKPIRDYAKYISNATLSWGHGLLSELTLSIPQESLQEKKKRLSERFAMLRNPVVVKIDDLDRLESSEVFEVLRLIRNTADLKNTIYVVAYDKEYVTNVLKNKDIKDASAYLEKIFPVEVHQPKVEDYQIMQVLYHDLKRVKLFNGKFADELLGRIQQKEKLLIVKILSNYRQTRRFVRIYSLNVLYIQKVFPNEIKLTDLFWMELLQTYDKTVYDVLAKEPDTLLYNNGGRYMLRPGVEEKNYILENEKQYEYKDEKIWKDGTEDILKLLFDKYIDVTPSSICKIENYDKFFTLGVSPFKLSKRDFQNLFIKKGEEEKTVRGWIDDGKYYGSVRYMFENCKVGELDEDGLKSYILGALSFGYVLGKYKYNAGRNVRTMLEQQHFKPKQYKLGREVIIQWFGDKIGKLNNPVVITQLLNRLFVSNEYDENNRKLDKQPLLITNDDVVKMLHKAMSNYLKQHPELTALDLFYEKTEVGKVFKNCCVQTDEGVMYDEFDSWENVAIDTVINHFKGKPKQALEDEKEAIEKMYMDDVPEWDDDPEAQDYYENAYELRERQLNAYFGSSNEQFNKLREACFTADANNNVKVAKPQNNKPKGDNKQIKKKKKKKRKRKNK